jgi:hypothetical protein
MTMTIEVKSEEEPDGFEYCPELEADDPAFTRTMQAELFRRIEHDKANTDDFVGFETLRLQCCLQTTSAILERMDNTRIT